MCQREGNAETAISVRVFVFFLYKKNRTKNNPHVGLQSLLKHYIFDYNKQVKCL